MRLSGKVKLNETSPLASVRKAGWKKAVSLKFFLTLLVGFAAEFSFLELAFATEKPQTATSFDIIDDSSDDSKSTESSSDIGEALRESSEFSDFRELLTIIRRLGL